jgi:hypothetical protein
MKVRYPICLIIDVNDYLKTIKKKAQEYKKKYIEIIHIYVSIIIIVQIKMKNYIYL